MRQGVLKGKSRPKRQHELPVLKMVQKIVSLEMEANAVDFGALAVESKSDRTAEKFHGSQCFERVFKATS